MGAEPDDNLVDLTASASPQSDRRAGANGRRRVFVSLLDDEPAGDALPNRSPQDRSPPPDRDSDSDIEMLETRQISPVRPASSIDSAEIVATQSRPRAKRPRPSSSHRESRGRSAGERRRKWVAHDDIVVVSERQITPQDRLREIQAQHREGRVVDPFQNKMPEQRPAPPMWLDMVDLHSLRMHAQQFPNARGPVHGNIMVPPRFLMRENPHMLIPPGILAPPFGSLYNEDQALEQTLLRSMDDTTRRHQVERSRIMMPPPPAPALEGYTRSLEESRPLVCVRCDRELGEDSPEDQHLSAETRLNNGKIFVRGCGHVYCGRCTYSMKVLPTRERGCLPKCKEVSAKKRGTFREVFI